MWKATFTDKSILVENQEGKERPFGDVLKRLTELKSLAVVTPHGDEYVVNFEDGVFTITREGISTYMYGLDPKTYQKVENVRPIYFVRERVDFGLGTDGTQTVQATEEFCAVGFQALLNEKNVQRYLKIFPNNTFEMVEE